MTNYLTTAETAKMIRAALKEAFGKQVKFSVKSSVYSGGSSIRVNWMDGPAVEQVEAIAKRFQGAYFDGMTDYKGYNKHMIDGQEISFGADFIFCNRDLSQATVQAAVDKCYAMYADLQETEKPVVKTFSNGAAYLDGKQAFVCGMWSHCFIMREAQQQSFATAEESKTANKVMFIGDDGYGMNALKNTVDLATF